MHTFVRMFSQFSSLPYWFNQNVSVLIVRTCLKKILAENLPKTLQKKTEFGYLGFVFLSPFQIKRK